MDRTTKEKWVREFQAEVRKANAVILTEYRGLKVSEITALKREIRKSEGILRVVKNRLAKKALAGSEWEPLGEHFKGPTAVACAHGDAVTLSKVLARYVESFAPLKFKVGFLSGRLVTPKEIDALSKLPSREQLYAKLLGVLQAPASNFVRALQGVPMKLARAVKEIEKTKGGTS